MTEISQFQRHFIFWVCVLSSTVLSGLIPMIEIPSENEFLMNKFWGFLIYAFTFLPFQMIAAYFIAYFVVPKYILKRKFVWGILLILWSAYTLSVLLRITMVHLVEPIVRIPPLNKEPVMEIITDLPHLIFKYTSRIYQVVVAFLLIKFFMDFKNQKEKILLMEKAKIESELKMLKMQLNPHFLFNTLNNIYSLALLKSDQTPHAIERLSKMLDYVIYEGQKKRIPLVKEVTLIENYIELERLRHPYIDLDFRKSIADNLQIAPLLLLSLVENAFKHSGTTGNKNTFIKIALKTDDKKLFFTISNSKGRDIQESAGKLGNRNLIKQLGLSYPSRHEIKFEDKTDRYCVKLTIDTIL
ncbi:sensor histidine kinase [Zunongwangia sp. HRR-M8]|uniref:sensor histidine kinase n=1 Tax=Zunongwangia sp. HRR-M8 TaxID=3015170 RepID=UPI0022DE41B0|nr:histidine kinase [Zunongwangia sp. HRR-M8]WBL22306.1 histidine kinase [Zunongwangia sp. HRR-M8]